jgi:hypothetical protein
VPDFDTSVPHIARVYDYWLGGKDNFAADREGVTRLFEGLELAAPGVVRAPEWRPDTELEAASPAVLWVGVARKPG